MLGVLREEREGKDPDFEAKAFHGSLLEQGAIALPMTIRRAFGQAQWQGVQARLGLERP
jgi:hypothetical protein